MKEEYNLVQMPAGSAVNEQEEARQKELTVIKKQLESLQKEVASLAVSTESHTKEEQETIEVKANNKATLNPNCSLANTYYMQTLSKALISALKYKQQLPADCASKKTIVSLIKILVKHKNYILVCGSVDVDSESSHFNDFANLFNDNRAQIKWHHSFVGKLKVLKDDFIGYTDDFINVARCSAQCSDSATTGIYQNAKIIDDFFKVATNINTKGESTSAFKLLPFPKR